MTEPLGPDGRVRNALAVTLAAGSARIEYAWRRGDPFGRISPSGFGEAGVVDLRTREARTKSIEVGPEHVYTDGMRLDRWDRAARWSVGGTEAPDSITGPLGFLDALGRLLPVAPDARPGQHRGDPVTRYSISFADGGPRSRLLERDAEVWLDDDGRVRVFAVARKPAPAQSLRRMPSSMRAMLEAIAGTPDEPAWETTELWDFGTPVEIDRPPASEVAPRRTRIGVVPTLVTLLDPRVWREMREAHRSLGADD